MAYYRKNKRRFDPRYFMNERMEVGDDEEEEEEEEEDPIGAADETQDETQDFGDVAEDCGEPVDVEELGGGETFADGWAAALGEISSMIAKLVPGDDEDEDADPVGDQVVDIEALPQMIVQPPLEE